MTVYTFLNLFWSFFFFKFVFFQNINVEFSEHFIWMFSFFFFFEILKFDLTCLFIFLRFIEFIYCLLFSIIWGLKYRGYLFFGVVFESLSQIFRTFWTDGTKYFNYFIFDFQFWLSILFFSCSDFRNLLLWNFLRLYYVISLKVFKNTERSSDLYTIF